MRKVLLLAAIVSATALAITLSPTPAPVLVTREYDVRILRDSWGVPHIFGKTDADAAFGLGYAHAEDDFATIVDTMLMVRGRLARYKGREGAITDYLVHLMRVWDRVNAQYETDLSPETRAVCEGYADGVNRYAERHPGQVPRAELPFTGKDVVAGFVFRLPFFFKLDNRIRELFANERQRDVSRKSTETAAAILTGGLPIGSNSAAVSPKRSANGETFLNINSHQPWEGPVAWYEAHMVSEEGMDIVGGTFPGAPIILLGHNRNLGWTHTVNDPDLIDTYVLEVNPKNRNQYRFDGAWRDFDRRSAGIKVKLWGPFSFTFWKETLWSVHGPALRTPHGVYAIRYAGMEDIRSVEQWYRMGKASNLDEWTSAMRMRAIPSLNCTYADKDGNIYYLYNARFPIRAEGYDWTQYLPGDTPETLWTEYAPFEALPQVLNPESGFVQSCNNRPYTTTIGPENPAPDDFSPTFGIETHMTNRGLRYMELLSADDSITEEEFYAYKYDMAYSKDSAVAQTIRKIIEAPAPQDPLLQEAVALLKTWDLRTNPENDATALALFTAGPNADGESLVTDLFEALGNAARMLQEYYGRLDVPWGQVNRLKRGKLNLPIGGGPDILHAVYGFRARNGVAQGFEDGQIYGRAGDCYLLIVTWDADGNVRSRAIHQYGSATLDERSPHYADQAPLFAQRMTRPVWMDEAVIRAHLEREYRP